MQDEIQPMAETRIVESSGYRNFNYNKLQAVLCIATSAVLTSGLIAWAIHRFF